MKHVQASRKNRVIRMLWLMEILVMVVAVAAAAWLRFFADPDGHAAFIENAPTRALIMALVVTGAMAAFGLYQTHGRH